MSFLPLKNNTHFIFTFVGAGSLCKLTFNSFNAGSTDNIKPALFAHQTNPASHHTQKAGYTFIANQTPKVLRYWLVNEPAPTKRLGVS
jgi:hypothetical protein